MDYKEQYDHPKWQEKRLRVLELNNFKCQACGDGETQLHVHHPQYRPGAKVWEYENIELKSLCGPCHEKAHQPLIIYFAGKISKNDWRSEFYSTDTKDLLKPIDWDLVETSFGYASGPFFVRCDHGCSHYSGAHGADVQNISACLGDQSGGNSMKEQVFKACIRSILRSSAMFVWIDDLSCYGTMFEIGYARAMNVPVYIAVDRALILQIITQEAEGPSDDLWFFRQAATKFEYHGSAGEAFSSFFKGG